MANPRRSKRSRKASPTRPPAAARVTIQTTAASATKKTAPGPRIDRRAPVVGKDSSTPMPWPRRGVTVLVTGVAGVCLLAGLAAHALGAAPDLGRALALPNPYVLIVAFPILAPLVRRLLDLRRMSILEALMLGFLVSILMLVASEVATPELLPASTKGESALQIYNEQSSATAATTLIGYVLGIILYKSFYRGFSVIWRGTDPLAKPRKPRDGRPWWRPWR